MFRKLTESLLIALLLTILALVGVVQSLAPTLPNIDTLSDIQLQIPLRVYTREGALIGEFGEKRRIPVRLDKMPQLAIHAVLAAEDDRFFTHPGVDWQGLLRATLHLLSTGKKTQGGSTITMQVARNFFLHREKTYRRKLREIMLALKIERQLSKEQIMELYLNKIFFGHRAYGIAAAAEVYYGQDIGDLSLAQIAMLAGIPQKPSEHNPVRNPQAALERRAYVLNRMLKLGYITAQQHRTASDTPVKAKLHTPRIEVEAPHVAEMTRTEMVRRYGEQALTMGYRVFTTLQARLQYAANQALKESLLEYSVRHGYRGPERYYSLRPEDGEAQWRQLLNNHQVLGGLHPALVVGIEERAAEVYSVGIGTVVIEWTGMEWTQPYIDGNRRGPKPTRATDIIQVGDVIRIREDRQGKWYLAPLPGLEGSLVAMNPVDGAAMALVGGFDFQRSQFNRITQAHRQPGSGFKPFIYSAALEAGYTAASIINDAPVVYDNIGADGEDWRPKNYSGKFYGPTRLREALVHSRNLVSVRLLDSVGIPFVKAYLQRFGFSAEKLPARLSLALGSGELTAWELARGYCVFANGGYRVDPYFIARIESDTGAAVYRHRPRKACTEPSCQDTGPGYYGSQVGLAVIDPGTAKDSDQAPRVISAENAWIVNSITREVIQRGTGVRARSLNRKDLSGKTGTTNKQKDAWFSGYNEQLAAVAWVGFDDSRPLGNRETGARAALPMWIRFMDKALEGTRENIRPQPKGLVNVVIDADTGLLADKYSKRTVNETFRASHVPAHNPGQPPTVDAAPDDPEGIRERLF
ncbi:MAG: penicillin-binding protein 1A [Gammaproteobacteria bacterium]|nr:penicillin-binding protein 1A [Gammaproteobacteria bacterium]